MRRILLFSALLITLSVCGKTPPPAGKVVCVLVDRSSSTEDQGVRQRYIEGFQRVVGRLDSGDVIVADAITDNPLAQSSFPVNDEFKPFQPSSDNELIVKKERENHQKEIQVVRERVLANAQGLFSSAPSNQTKILDAMRLAERVISAYQRPKRVLVIFSDMIEESERYNFKRERLTDEVIARIINEEKQAKRLPDLAGVRVYVIGAGASGNQPSSSEQYTEIENFWSQYFKAAGADLSKDRYGATLLKFDE
jgi:hypothetical protein